MLNSRWQPFVRMYSDMYRVREEINRALEQATGNGRTSPPAEFPGLNLWESKDYLLLEAELPGMGLDDLEIFVNGDNQLSIKGERKQPNLDKGTWHRQERSFGNFSRLVELPGAVNSEAVEADLKDGLLTIRLPMQEVLKPQKIEVKTG